MRWAIGLVVGSVCVHTALAAQESPNEADARYRSAALFANVLDVIREEYVDESKVDYEKLTYAALRGMLNSLDPHSQFLDPASYAEMQQETQGQFGGIGVSVEKMNSYLTINVPIEGTPGFKAGLLPGDRIIKVDGASTKSMSLGDAVKKLRGEPGSWVTLSIYRPSVQGFKEFKIVRELIDVPTVRDVSLLPPEKAGNEKIGYIRITQFGDKTVEEFEQALKTLQGQGAKGMILDLRNNPGGLLEAAVEVAGKFLPTGTVIVSTESRGGEATRALYYSPGRKRVLDLPMAVLINGNSASAAEIVAGALKDLRRAVLLGETTFGKGSVQTVQTLDWAISKPAAVKLTTSRYYTPSRRPIHEVGVSPDIFAPITWKEEQDLFLKKSIALLEPAEQERLAKVADTQFDRAIQMLRGVQLYAAKKGASLAASSNK
ncbi:MAG: S41 family peptidase [bacterium]